ncbi:MarR family transcriptional regulator [Streptomyces sp. JH34]|uniref:MarR family transcriptional regulator n=1 Tax=Streptomyces sp. JH34 TaxID=2793633 RepID=UPI0023F6EC2D|nr:MarR family transcriptional regulator [Streptomyces sp. JH34]MDF6019538.1 MarR family transcriptional regulator [Streptomyces sp. JH34]
MANPGYGKRSMPDQSPACADDFTLLPPRERCIAGFIDHLPDGASMDVKSLAKQLPLYGQQAVGSALRTLSVAGYLRRVRCLVGEGEQVRWVFRTFWSRTARDNEWWGARLAPEQREAAPSSVQQPPSWVPKAEPAPVAEPPAAPVVPQQRGPEPAPAADPVPSPAYLALAQLGRTEPRLALSAADCAVLEAPAAEWLARGVSTDYLTHALTSGLPAQVGSPVGLVRRRLADKIPPYVPQATTPHTPGGGVRRAMMECVKCGAAGRPEALPDGLCRPCGRPEAAEPEGRPAGGLAESEVRALAGHVRELLRSR